MWSRYNAELGHRKTDLFVYRRKEKGKMFSEYADIISIDDQMKMLHIGKTTAYTLVKEKRIQHVKVGRKYIIPQKVVIQFLEEMCHNKAQDN